MVDPENFDIAVGLKNPDKRVSESEMGISGSMPIEAWKDGKGLPILEIGAKY
jgi:hypothetical protein